MGDVERRDLGEVGRAYIREHLAGINEFCAALLETSIAEPGEVFTLAPVGVPDADLMQFDQGGLLVENWLRVGAVGLPDGSSLVPVASLIQQQATLLRETMVVSVGSVCVVDDFNRRWSERTSSLGPTAFGVGEEVYHLLTSDHAEEDFITVVSASNTIWHGVAAVCSESIALDSARESTAPGLKLCAASALLITCSAYDGEGFVAWRRTLS